MYGKNHYNIVISLQLIKIKGKKVKSPGSVKKKTLMPELLLWYVCSDGMRWELLLLLLSCFSHV